MNDTLPDSACTPGNVNPALTKEPNLWTLFPHGRLSRQGDYAGAEGTTYPLYSIPRPPENVGANQKCELDHWVSLELGGADDLSNI